MNNIQLSNSVKICSSALRRLRIESNLTELLGSHDKTKEKYQSRVLSTNNFSNAKRFHYQDNPAWPPWLNICLSSLLHMISKNNLSFFSTRLPAHSINNPDHSIFFAYLVCTAPWNSFSSKIMSLRVHIKRRHHSGKLISVIDIELFGVTNSMLDIGEMISYVKPFICQRVQRDLSRFE